MKNVQLVKMRPQDAEQRLDRWFKRHYPGLSHGHLEKLLRTGQIRLDGKRAAASDRLIEGQELRIPPLPETAQAAIVPSPSFKRKIDPHKIEDLKARILYQDEDILALDKPSGLPVQGGSGIALALDDMLDHLCFEAKEKPRLVHRLDRDTSGVLLLARNEKAARRLTEMFRTKETRKTYWALLVGVPHPLKGRIDLNLAKGGGPGKERVNPDEEGKRAITYYSVIEHAGKKASFVALMPITGRTHQLRAHCVAMNHPIIGDGKYGGALSHLGRGEIPSRLHLHARQITIPKLKGRGSLIVTAPLPKDLRKSWKFFGFSPEREDDFFAGIEEE